MGGRKLALVDWGTICQPRTYGGLRLRRLQDQNKYFLLKLGINLITNQNALWTHVLRSKYGMKEALLESIGKRSCSALWKAIEKIWPLLKENLCLSVGARTEICCWKDNWIPTVGPLLKHVQNPNRTINGCMLKDMITEEGVWNLEAFRENLAEEIIQKIIDTPPPPHLAGPHKIRWIPASIGKFSIKNAYQYPNPLISHWRFHPCSSFIPRARVSTTVTSMVNKDHVTMNGNGNSNWFSKMEEEFSRGTTNCIYEEVEIKVGIDSNCKASSEILTGVKYSVNPLGLGCLGDVFFLNEQLLVFDQSGLACIEEIRSTAKEQTICQQVYCLPATTSSERLEYLDDDEHILSMIIVGGDLRLKHK
ncbi:hypothetical protein Goklo_029083, partial [Gossypium klotzschianum]|nr:hypothetical protein [Gossypium klotzschianum]